MIAIPYVLSMLVQKAMNHLCQDGENCTSAAHGKWKDKKSWALRLQSKSGLHQHKQAKQLPSFVWDMMTLKIIRLRLQS